MGKRIRDYLGLVFKIYARDLKRILVNPIALIFLLGACALPSAYAWYCTAANWDPYQNTEGITVAVANEDAGASTKETGKLDIGKEVQEKLEGNHQLGWKFYDSSEEAIESVYSGNSYAAIVIPSDFSECFTSILTGDFKQPKIDYYINQKISAAAPEFTDEGATVVKDDINQQFVETVAETVLGITHKLGINLKEKDEAAEGSLTSGIGKAGSAIDEAHKSLSGMTPEIDKTSGSVAKAKEMLDTMKEYVPKLQTALEKTQTSLEKTREAASAYEQKALKALSSAALNMSQSATTAQVDAAKASSSLLKLTGETGAALAEAQGIASSNQTIISQLQPLAGSNKALQDAINSISASNKDLQSTISSMQNAVTGLSNSVKAADTLIDDLASDAEGTASSISSGENQLRDDVFPAINSTLDDYSQSIGTLSGMVSQITPTVDLAKTTLDSLSEALDQSKTALTDIDTSLQEMKKALEATEADLHALGNSDAVKDMAEFLKLDEKDVSSFISSPVKLSTNDVYPVKNYGSGVVAFFSSVALWVAGFVFIDLLKVRVDPAGLPRFTRNQAYFARWLLFMTLGLLPPIIVCTGDLILGIQCVNPVAFIAAGLVSGLVYVNFIYALAHAFRYIGKALAVLFLIVQIPGSSGLYPIQMMPGFYQLLHPLLPFTYTINAFRESIGGFYGMNYFNDLLILVLIYVPLGFLIGLVLGRAANNLTYLLDLRIGTTGLFDGEKIYKKISTSPSTLIKTLVNSDEYRQKVFSYAKSFKKAYPKLRMLGWVLFVAQFVVMLALMIIIQADTNTKLFLLTASVIGIIVVDVYLIALVYLKERLKTNADLLSLPKSALSSELSESSGMGGAQ